MKVKELINVTLGEVNLFTCVSVTYPDGDPFIDLYCGLANSIPEHLYDKDISFMYARKDILEVRVK